MHHQQGRHGVLGGPRRADHPPEQLLAVGTDDLNFPHHIVGDAMLGRALRVRQARRTQTTQDGIVRKPAQPPRTHGCSRRFDYQFVR